MHVVGHTELGEPVIYSCLALATNRVAKENEAHMISTFEQVRCQSTLATMQDGGNKSAWVNEPVMH